LGDPAGDADSYAGPASEGVIVEIDEVAANAGNNANGLITVVLTPRS
jgi:hypothetical protein